jgi:hypothetical protein
VPIEFFFEGSPHAPGQHHAQTDAPFPQFVSDYLATSDGLGLTKAYVQIPDAKIWRSIVNLVASVAHCVASVGIGEIEAAAGR